MAKGADHVHDSRGNEEPVKATRRRVRTPKVRCRTDSSCGELSQNGMNSWEFCTKCFGVRCAFALLLLISTNRSPTRPSPSPSVRCICQSGLCCCTRRGDEMPAVLPQCLLPRLSML